MRGSFGWNGKRIVFVTGKGGVGKSLVAAAIARTQAQQGRKTLLVEIGENSYYKDFWRLPAVGHEPQSTPHGFDLALWSGESCLREYVLFYLKLERLYKLFFDNKVMRALIGVAPGLSELAILGKITSGIRSVGPSLPYEVIVVDTFATGHALALFRAPKGMQEAIKFGPMGHHSRDIQNVLQNSSLTRYVIVTLPEELPVVETLELKQALAEELSIDADVICNKMLKIPLNRSELSGLSAAMKRHRPQGSEAAELVGFLSGVGERQDRLISHLRSGGAKTLYQVPLVFSSDPDVLVKEAATELSMSRQ